MKPWQKHSSTWEVPWNQRPEQNFPFLEDSIKEKARQSLASLEDAKLYKLNFYNKKALSEPIFLIGPSWNDIDNMCKKAYTKYCELWEIF